LDQGQQDVDILDQDLDGAPTSSAGRVYALAVGERLPSETELRRERHFGLAQNWWPLKRHWLPPLRYKPTDVSAGDKSIRPAASPLELEQVSKCVCDDASKGTIWIVAVLSKVIRGDRFNLVDRFARDMRRLTPGTRHALLLAFRAALMFSLCSHSRAWVNTPPLSPGAGGGVNVGERRSLPARPRSSERFHCKDGERLVLARRMLVDKFDYDANCIVQDGALRPADLDVIREGVP
jgi:hypothetical protein